MPMKHFSAIAACLHSSRSALLAFMLSMACFPASSGPDTQLLLPELGDSSSGIVSHDQEHELGRSWLRLYRSRVPESRDALMYDYLHALLNRLASHSALEDKRLELVVISNPTINAFAVPGGIVGVHTGIFQYAGSEQELAGILSHELAHLSQRHFVRGIEKQRQNSIPTMAGMLAGLALMATTGSDVGLATVMATQAASLESQLRFSRENESEADRVGMQTMASADMNPQAIPDMFESMQRATRFMGSRPPEFLLSHPVTEKRLADSRNRADQYPQRQFAVTLDYQLMRARARLAAAENASVAARTFQTEINGQNNEPDANHYGLALAQIAQRQFDAATLTLKPLLAKDPTQLAYQLASAEILLGQKQTAEALGIVKTILQQKPLNYPATMLCAQILQARGDYKQATQLLDSLLPQHSNSPFVWYELAETRGMAGDIGGVHLARAEYFMLNGIFDKARQQLTYALKAYEKDHMQSARIKQRLRDLAEIENQTLKI
jgi:predicted Zn-dependent protease